jgi:plasmid maintenance system antidote protein VapI
MHLSESFSPDWASRPGDTINDVLRERKVSIDDFADRMGQSPAEIADLLQGRSAITLGIARRLEQVLGASVEFWMSREFRYRQHTTNPSLDDNTWLQGLPVADMLKFGWLSAVRQRSEILSACLRFFGVPNIAAWHRVYGPLGKQYLFRTSPSFESKPGALFAWLRRGEIEAETIECAPWNPLAFKNTLHSIRSLTRERDPKHFLPRLQQMCSQAGVAVAIVRSPNGCRASGATRFLSRNKALLLLSFRYLRDDQFWFSFFHECGHLLLHGRDDVFVEEVEGERTSEEQEANAFAFQLLIPPEFQSDFFLLAPNSFQLARFARRIGIAPGIVVGQLQYHGKIKPNHFNGLKRRYKWE